MVKTAFELLQENILEETVHTHISKWLDLVLLPGTYYTTVENSNRQGGAAGKIKQIKNKARGVKTGFPDILLIHSGKAFLMEIKRWGKYATPGQLAEHDKLRDAGAIVAEDSVHNIDEARIFLKNNNIPIRERE